VESTTKYPPIGDDGRYMTPTRILMHRCFNALLVWAIVCIVAAVAFTIAAYFQGQSYEDLELIASGGTVFNGTSVASLMRIEAGYCFVSGILFIAMHLLGFVWMYERGSEYPSLLAMGAACMLALVWIGYLVSLGTCDVIAVICLLVVAVTLVLRSRVKAEARDYDLTV